ncbi:MarR family transcriptional regulator [Rhizobium sp. EC-SD404]|uniref:MarR family winged helix-turn-helix transcriptional regulator n=1 Tax=Rhizobium sp. EC-SD404 TaxID=2038389 RepID=UPI001259183F|nr:MarR family transcriptional regulator [Rhizobium sp. EC-SD404]
MTSTLRLEEFLPYRLARAAEIVSRDFAALYRERHGMTRPEWRVFATIGQFGTITATAIGAHSSMHKTKVSRAVFSLEKRRWINRQTDGADRRVERLQLTREGMLRFAELSTMAQAYEAQLVSAIGPEATGHLVKAMAALETYATAHGRPDER